MSEMDCPVCKYPNPPGVTHCGMCQEVFNRSAAQTYLHAVKRERLSREEEQPAMEEAIVQTQRVVDEVKTKVSVIDWNALAEQTLSYIKRSRKAVLVGAGLLMLWTVLSFLFSAGLWYTILGKKLSFAYPDKNPPVFLIGMKTSIRTWSERHGMLDTPMEHFKVDELGNVVLEKKAAAKKASNTVVIAHTKEWVQISNDAGAPISRTIEKKHPSLADARIVLNKSGTIVERRFVLSPRLAKSVPFLAPRFPAGRLRRGRQWTDTIEWLDTYNAWQIEWKGTLHWTLGELTPCGQNTCVQLTCKADLEPRLYGVPSWAHGGVHRVEAAASGEGQALFDPAHHRLVSNTLSYDGLLRIPIDDLARIPWELRIGHRVKGPGEIVTRFENQIDIRKN